MPFGIRHIGVIVITGPEGTHTHPFDKQAGSYNIQQALRDPNGVIVIDRDHLYPVRHVHSVDYTTRPDLRNTSVQLWQSDDLTRLYLRDPDSANAYELINPADGNFAPTADGLTAGTLRLTDSDTMRLHQGLDGLQLAATWRPTGIERNIEQDQHGEYAAPGPAANKFITKP